MISLIMKRKCRDKMLKKAVFVKFPSSLDKEFSKKMKHFKVQYQLEMYQERISTLLRPN